MTTESRQTDTPRTDAVIKVMDRAQDIDHENLIDLCNTLEHELSAERLRADEAEAEIERGFRHLEAFGVPKERARSVPNGIGVLESRLSKAVRDERTAKECAEQRLAKIEKAAGMPEEPKKYLSSSIDGGMDESINGRWVLDYDHDALRASHLHETAARLEAERRLGVMTEDAKVIACIYIECFRPMLTDDVAKAFAAFNGSRTSLTDEAMRRIFGLPANPIPATPDQQAAVKPIE